MAAVGLTRSEGPPLPRGPVHVRGASSPGFVPFPAAVARDGANLSAVTSRKFGGGTSGWRGGTGLGLSVMAEHSSTGWHCERKVSQPAWLARPAACSWSSKCACESSRRTGSCNVRTLGT
jgi:hypothetical protein